MPLPFRIVAFGSSSTEGSGATTTARSYPGRLAALLESREPDLPTEVLNRGVGGDDIRDMMARVDRDVLAADPALVIWQVGSNDPLKGVTPKEFKTALLAGIEAMLAGGADVMLMEPQWSPALDEADPEHAFVTTVREVGACRGLHVIRRFALMREWFATGRASPSDVIGADGLHMTDLGYEFLAEAVFDAVLQHSGAFAAFRRA